MQDAANKPKTTAKPINEGVGDGVERSALERLDRHLERPRHGQREQRGDEQEKASEQVA